MKRERERERKTFQIKRVNPRGVPERRRKKNENLLSLKLRMNVESNTP